ncbi:hypothetical protein V2O64_20050 [Verrucomicrobiaceae bacterium 227]
MKIIFALTASLLFPACKNEAPTITVYDEITTFSYSEGPSATGAKVILLKNLDSYSTVKVISCENGQLSELAKHELDESETGNHAFSLRLYPVEKGALTWSFLYRGNGTGSSSISIYGETLSANWQITAVGNSRHGHLEETIEPLSSFLLYKDPDDFPFEIMGAFDPFDSVKGHQATSKKHPKIRIILLTLE